MGDRVSIRFVHSGNPMGGGNTPSVTLFNHWGGITFVEEATAYVSKLKADNPTNSQMSPLDRRQPDTVMVDFIRHITNNEGKPLDRSLYLGATPNDGDNSDNGHHDIELS